jgi:hypothetical protein
MYVMDGVREATSPYSDPYQERDVELCVLEWDSAAGLSVCVSAHTRVYPSSIVVIVITHPDHPG